MLSFTITKRNSILLYGNTGVYTLTGMLASEYLTKEQQIRLFDPDIMKALTELRVDESPMMNYKKELERRGYEASIYKEVGKVEPKRKSIALSIF